MKLALDGTSREDARKQLAAEYDVADLDALLDDVPPEKHREFHAQAAVRLDAVGAPPARIAHHLIAAGQLSDAVPHVLTAAETQALDREVEARGVSIAALMERAGAGVARGVVEVAGAVYGRRVAAVSLGAGLVAAAAQVTVPLPGTPVPLGRFARPGAPRRVLAQHRAGLG